MQRQMQTRKRSIVIMMFYRRFCIIVCLLLSGCFFDNEKKSTCLGGFAREISVGLSLYHEYYGEFPSGDTSNVLDALSGDNPEGIPFYIVDSSYYDKKGMLVGPCQESGGRLEIELKEEKLILRYYLVVDATASNANGTKRTEYNND